MQKLPWQYEELSEIVSKHFNYSFKSKKLLIQSLRHSSYTYESRMLASECNERLEFLGDSVLSLFVSDILCQNLSPDLDEGILSQIRSSLVNEERFSEFLRFSNLDKYFLLGKGEDKNGGRTRNKNLCRLFEAFIGALFEDSNYEETKKSLHFFFRNYEKAENINLFSTDSLEDFDAKSKLQVLFMKKFKVTPRYKFTKMSENEFKAEVFLRDKKLGFSSGKSKKEAVEKIATLILNEPARLEGLN